MKGRQESVWLNGKTRKLLRKVAERLGYKKSRVLREAFFYFVGADKKWMEEQAVLEQKLAWLEEEDKRLVRAQKLILKNRAYLQKYVRKLMQGGWNQQHAKLGSRRPPLPETPGASLTIKALEGIFARRYEIAEEVARLALKCWKGKFDVGTPMVKPKFQVGLVAFPLCPYWATSLYNRRFEGPPDRKHCDLERVGYPDGKEVSVRECWVCWRKGMKEKVELEEDWDSWRKSKEYQELRVYLDQFDFDENMEWLRRRNGRSVATVNKQPSRGDKKHGSDT